MTARNPKTSTQTILGNVMKILAPRLDPHGVQAGLFAEALYSSAVPEALSDMDSQALEGIALSLFDFVRRRTPGQAKVRAYTPNRNDHGWASSHSVVEIVNDDMPFLVDSVVAATPISSTTARRPASAHRSGRRQRGAGRGAEGVAGLSLGTRVSRSSTLRPVSSRRLAR